VWGIVYVPELIDGERVWRTKAAGRIKMLPRDWVLEKLEGGGSNPCEAGLLHEYFIHDHEDSRGRLLKVPAVAIRASQVVRKVDLRLQ
jgi:hypothetical protein